MSEKAIKRSGMLGTIYNMLPHIDDDYAAKLVYTLEDKKSIGQLQHDIANISAQIASDSPIADTIIAKILLDEITLSAASRRLRIHTNSTSITELSEVLQLPKKQYDLLSQVYASFSSRLYFDEELEKALNQVKAQNLSEAEQAKQAVDILRRQAEERLSHSRENIRRNQNDIFKMADKYHLSVKLTALLQRQYSLPETVLFQPEFEQMMASLSDQSTDQHLCAVLAAHTLLCHISLKDAQNIALLQKLLHRDLLTDDLLVIACRYLRVKTPQDITAVFEAVLRKLPHVADPNENLGLAVRVLLDGTQTSLAQACEQAAIRRDTEVLRLNLEKYPVYNGYEEEISKHFGGKKDFVQLEQEMKELLGSLPFCSNPEDNKELACKVLLGSLSKEEAVKQAEYLRDLKATSITQGLAPEIMKNYLGTQPADEIIRFFNESLDPYTFWKSDREKHIFALQVLVRELNGTFNRRISQFVLDMLEKGSSLQLMTDMLETIQEKKNNPEELEDLLVRYEQARADSQIS